MLHYKGKIARTKNTKTCLLCGANIVIHSGYKYNQIIKCSNNKCLSNISKKSFKFKRLAFFEDKYNQHISKDLLLSTWVNKKGWESEESAIIARNHFLVSTENGEIDACSKKEQWNPDYLIRQGYTVKKANEIIEERKSKTSHYQIKYWLLRGYSENEAVEKIKLLQSKNASKVNYDNRILPSNLEYWIAQGMNIDEAIVAQKKFFKDNYSLNKNNCRNYDLMIENRKKTWMSKTDKERSEINKTRGRTFEQLIESFGIDKAISILDKRSKAFKEKNWSKISKELFDIISKDIDECYYAENEKLFYLDNRRYYADFCYKKIIIEFHGDVFHGNPSMFSITDKPNPFNNLTCKEIYEQDDMRKLTFEKHGYTYICVWENDYKNNKKEIINNLKTILYNEQKNN